MRGLLTVEGYVSIILKVARGVRKGGLAQARVAV